VPVTAGNNYPGPIPAESIRFANAVVRCGQVDLIGAHPENLTQPAQLWHLWRAPSALPKIYGLGLNPDLERQLELGPAAFLPQGSDRFHIVSLPPTRLNSCTITAA
jgi:hypothetical protein